MHTQNQQSHQAPAAPKFVRTKVLANQLGVRPETILRWANDGRISMRKINRKLVLFDQDEVIAFINNARVA